MSQERVSGVPDKGADLRGSPGPWGSLGNFRGTSGLLLSSTVRELPGKSPTTSGKFGELLGKSGTSQKLGGADSYQRLAKFVSNELPGQVL